MKIRPFAIGDEGALYQVWSKWWGESVAYAHAQASGYIDHFFVAGSHAQQGIGRMLMERLHEVAANQVIDSLGSHVSRTAQPFFGKFGFVIVEQRSPLVSGVVVPNALMRKKLVRPW